MNLDFDPSSITRIFQRILAELREKRLWPVAVALLVATVAVPVVLAKSSNPAGPPAGVGTPPPAAATSLPTISEQSTPSQSHLTGRARNPFAQQASGKASSSTTTARTTAATTAATATSTAGSASRTGGTGTSGTTVAVLPTATTTAPGSITTATPKAVPAGLTSTQSYDVSLAITNPSGGIDTIDPLQRLSVLPSDQQPLLVELGVAQRGNRVLFVVQPGTSVGGPGRCTPGPIDCEILSLAQDQTEGVSSQSPSGQSQVTSFAVTAITVVGHPSAVAAQKARQQESAAGRKLLDSSTVDALSLFRYDPNVGAVVDLSNLTAGAP